MTIINIDGFETYGDGTTSFASIKANIEATDNLRSTTTTGLLPVGYSIVTGFNSVGLALKIDDTGSSSSRGEHVSFAYGSGFNDTTGALTKEYVFGFRYYNGELDSASVVPARIIWNNTIGTYSASPSHTRASSLQVRPDGTTLRYTPMTGSAVDAALALTVNTWHFIEIHYKPTNTANSCFMKVYVDGALVIDNSVGNVVSATFYRSLGCQLGCTSSGGSNDGPDSVGATFDDVYILHVDGVTHTDVLGDVRVVPLAPTGDSTPNAWTPSTGTDNSALLDETDWDTADYVDATTSGNDDHYTLENVDANTVMSVRVDSVCQATSGTPRLFIGLDDGTASESDEGVIGTGSVVQKTALFNLDPSGASWTPANLNSVEGTQRMTE